MLPFRRATEYRKCGHLKPWAVQTKLRWMLSGPLHQEETVKLASENLVAEVGPLADEVKTCWSMETYASNCSISGRPEEVEEAIELLNATTKFDGERKKVGLLWIKAKPHLPKN